MKKLLIKRIEDDGFQTLGEATLYDNGIKVFEFVTLEPEWNDNKTNSSSIPVGKYKVLPRNSAKYDDHFHVQDVKDRSYILLHVGNYRKDSTGCILVGKQFMDINGDGKLDVNSSKDTLKKLLELAPDGFELEITAKSNGESAMGQEDFRYDSEFVKLIERQSEQKVMLSNLNEKIENIKDFNSEQFNKINTTLENLNNNITSIQKNCIAHSVVEESKRILSDGKKSNDFILHINPMVIKAIIIIIAFVLAYLFGIEPKLP